MSQRLKYYDGYFFHHVTIFAQPAGPGQFNAMIHKSGTLPEAVRVGASPQMERNTWGVLVDARPLAVFATAEEAEIAAKDESDKTTGAWCKNFYYRG